MLEDKAILVVDDDATLLEMYEERLRAEGASVEYAHDGKEAVEVATQNSPNLIILDVMMPKMNGLDALKMLKATENTKNIPVIILTALADEEKLKQSRQLGAIGYFVKSETMPGELIEKITNYIK